MKPVSDNKNNTAYDRLSIMLSGENSPDQTPAAEGEGLSSAGRSALALEGFDFRQRLVGDDLVTLGRAPLVPGPLNTKKHFLSVPFLKFLGAGYHAQG